MNNFFFFFFFSYLIISVFHHFRTVMITVHGDEIKKKPNQTNKMRLFFFLLFLDLFFFPIKIKTAVYQRCKFIYMQPSVCVYSVWLLYINIYTHEHRLLACIGKEKLISLFPFYGWLVLKKCSYIFLRAYFLSAQVCFKFWTFFSFFFSEVCVCAYIRFIPSFIHCVINK